MDKKAIAVRPTSENFDKIEKFAHKKEWSLGKAVLHMINYYLEHEGE